MRPGRGLVLLVVAATLLAGCAKPTPADAEAAGNGLASAQVRGVVLDAAIRPLADAEVLVPARPDLAPQRTGIDGSFTVDGLEPGVVFVEVRKEGYLSSVVQATAGDTDVPVTQVILTALEETKPFFTLESFRGLMECGVGSAPVFGLSAGCMVVLGGALYLACTGSDPIPPTGVCLGQTSPYFTSMARGNMSMAQTELVWDATLPGPSELTIGSYVVDDAGAIVGAVPGATGPSVLVRRLNETVVHENQLGGAHSLALFVSPGNAGTANLVVQQPFQLFHTSTFYFLLDEPWTFAVDGPPVVPDGLLG